MAEVNAFTIGAIGFFTLIFLAGSITGFILVWRANRAGDI